jgi:hypothetical protein
VTDGDGSCDGMQGCKMSVFILKAGQYIRDGKLYGWTGRKCQECQGYGEDVEARACTACAGTGDEHGEICNSIGKDDSSD